MKKYLISALATLILASTPGGSATLSLSPEGGNYQVGEAIPVSIFFNTTNIPISAIALRLTYPYSGNSPEINPSNILINQTLLASGDWACPIKTVSAESGTVKIDIACANVNPSGYTNSSDTLLASFNLGIQSIPAINPLVLSFDPNLSVISRKSDAQDILQTPTAVGTYTIGSIPTGTITPTVTLTPTPTPPSPTATPTITPTPGGPTPTSPPGPCGCVRVKLYQTDNTPLDLNQIKGGQTVRIFVEGTGTTQWKARYRINNGIWVETTKWQSPIGYYDDWTIPTQGGTFNIEGQINCSGTWAIPSCTLNFAVRLLGDFDNDGKIDGTDLAFLLGKWGSSQADLNNDNKTNESDLTILLSNWKL